MPHEDKVTLRQALAQARARLAVTPQAASAAPDAALLMRHVTGLTAEALLTHPDRNIAPSALAAFYLAIERRAQSEPVQYITGVQEFYGLAFLVNPAVLIPRPETEHLVEAAVLLARSSFPGPVRIADIGTGSGAIAITLAHLLSQATITATDISRAAFEVARHNAKRHHVEARITFVECDLIPTGAEPFDIICSNPPYVPSGELLEAQVAAFEPQSALFAGADGLDIYRRLIPGAAKSLRPGGWLLLEIGYGQQDVVAELLTAADLQEVRFDNDLQGIPRVAIATKGQAGTRD